VRQNVLSAALLPLDLLRRIPPAIVTIERGGIHPTTEQTHDTGLERDPADVRVNSAVDIINSGGCRFAGDISTITIRRRDEPAAATLPSTSSPSSSSPQRRYPDTSVAREQGYRPRPAERER